MVYIEVIRICGDPLFTWRLWKSAEQFVRLFWVGFLVFSYTSSRGIRTNLFILCIYCVVYEVIKGIAFHKAKNSYLIGKNPKLIHNYVKRIILRDDLRTTPMKSCDYIVMGEENHEIAVCSNGFVLGEKKSNSEGMLTIGTVFQLNPSEDETLTLLYPYWRNTCLSLALAKMLRRRFAKLPVDEAGCQKALNFVLKGLIDYIGTDQDIQTDQNNGERNQIGRRVFSIIRKELKFVSELLQMKVLIYRTFQWYFLVDYIGFFVMNGTLISVSKNTSVFKSYMVKEENNPCFSLVLGHSSVVPKIVSVIDSLILYLLAGACIYIQMSNFVTFYFKLHITLPSRTDPAKWNKLVKWLRLLIARQENVKEGRVNCFSVLHVSSRARLPKWIQNLIPKSSPTVIHTDAKESIMRSLQNSSGRLTNGETSLKTYCVEHLNWACPPNGSTTEAILVWHIATTLFYHQKPSPDLINDPPQDASPQHNNNLFKEQKVALALSSYCLYLVVCLPELLPDEVESTEEMYGCVTKEILARRPRCCCQKSRKTDCYNYVLETPWGENSVVGKGVKLFNDLMKCADDGSQVWTMLSEFWAEMMLFVAPSDNVDGHEKILHKGEFITQLWALLTHAGIVTRPKPTEHQDHQSESNAVSGDINV